MAKKVLYMGIISPQARLVVQCLGKVGGVDHLEQFGTHHIYNYRSCLAAYLVAVGGYHHFMTLSATIGKCMQAVKSFLTVTSFSWVL